MYISKFSTNIKSLKASLNTHDWRAWPWKKLQYFLHIMVRFLLNCLFSLLACISLAGLNLYKNILVGLVGQGAFWGTFVWIQCQAVENFGTCQNQLNWSCIDLGCVPVNTRLWHWFHNFDEHSFVIKYSFTKTQLIFDIQLVRCNLSFVYNSSFVFT